MSGGLIQEGHHTEIATLSVHIATVAHDHNINNALLMIGVVDDSVIAHSDSPQVARTTDLLASVRSWLSCKRLDFGQNAMGNLLVQAFQFPSC